MSSSDATEPMSVSAPSIDRPSVERPFQFSLGSLLPFVASVAIVASIYAYMGTDNVPWRVAFVFWLIASFFFSLWTYRRRWPFIVSILVLLLGLLGVFATRPAALFAITWFAQLCILLMIPIFQSQLTRLAKPWLVRWYVAVTSLAIGFSIWFLIPVPEASWILRARQEYPVVDLSTSLAYEERSKTSPLPKVSKVSLTRLDELEQLVEHDPSIESNSTIQLGPIKRWRTETLERIHNDQYLRFVRTEGAGVSRMRPIGLNVSNTTILAMPLPNEGIATSRKGRSIPWLVSTDDAYSDKQLSIEFFHAQRRLSLDQLHFYGVVDFVNPVGWGWSPEFQKAAGFVDHAFYVSPDTTQNEGLTYSMTSLQLVTIDRFDKPQAFVLDGLPRMDKITGDNVPTRALTDFEHRGLTALQSGEDIVVETHAPELFMVGAIRATKQCLQCHDARRGELLGAFTYRFLAANSESPIAESR